MCVRELLGLPHPQIEKETRRMDLPKRLNVAPLGLKGGRSRARASSAAGSPATPFGPVAQRAQSPTIKVNYICVELLAPRAPWCCPRSRAARKKPSPRRSWRPQLFFSSSDTCDSCRIRICQGRRKSSIKQSFNSAGYPYRMLQAESSKLPLLRMLGPAEFGDVVVAAQAAVQPSESIV